MMKEVVRVLTEHRCPRSDRERIEWELPVLVDRVLLQSEGLCPSKHSPGHHGSNMEFWSIPSQGALISSHDILSTRVTEIDDKNTELCNSPGPSWKRFGPSRATEHSSPVMAFRLLESLK